MHWNYRKIEHEDQYEVYQAIHEVVYEDDGTIEGWSANPVEVTKYDMESWSDVMGKLQEALKKPVLVIRYDMDKGCNVLEEKE